METLELEVSKETVESLLSGHIVDLPISTIDKYIVCGAKLESSASGLTNQWGEGEYSDYVSSVASCFAELSQTAFDFKHASGETLRGRHLSAHYGKLQELVKIYAEGIELAGKVKRERRDEFLSFVYRVGDKIEFVNNIRDPGYQMNDFLIAQLEACPEEDRGAVALALARTRTDRAVDALIDKVEGKPYGKLGGFVPFTGTQYGAKDRLKVIYALGESGKGGALEYLKHSLSVRKVGWTHEKSEGFLDITWAHVNYPNAQGALRTDLRGKVSRINDNKRIDVFFQEHAREVVNPSDGEERIGCRAPHFERSKAHHTAERAVKRLTDTLGFADD